MLEQPEMTDDTESEAAASAPSTAADELVDHELLVEEVSIDGMCGVY